MLLSNVLLPVSHGGSNRPTRFLGLKRYLSRSIRFCTIHPRVQRTDHDTCDMCRKGPHLRTACGDASFAAPDAPNVGEASFSTRHGAPQPLTPSPAYGPHLEKNPVGAPVCAMSHAGAAGATARRCVYIYARLALASMSPIITRRIPACLRHTNTAATVIRN